MIRNAAFFTRNVVLCVCSLVGWSGVRGQSASALEQRYSRPFVLEIRPGVNVYPAFTPDGDVCRMVIAKHPDVNNKHADMNTAIPPALVKAIEDELVPPDERGPELSPYLSPESFVAGGASLIQKDYDNVSLGVYGSSGDAYAIVITWRHRLCSE
jgi:hypothetical protein